MIVLVQLGGLGVMTFTSLVGLAVARRLSLSTRLSASAETAIIGLEDVKGFVFGAITISLVIEAVAAVVLTFQFGVVYGMPFGEALWQGVFHAISAFNNAGFSLFRNGLTDYVRDPVISLTISFAVLLGSFGFPVLVQLVRTRWQARLWSMNTRLVLAGSAALTVLGTAFITIIEWNNPATFGPLSWPEKLIAGFFQDVQTRSGGFTTVDFSQLDSGTLLGMDVLMFIGGGPAGTAGGIKITTFGVLFFIIVAEMRGRTTVNVFGKQLAPDVQRQAITVALVAVAAVFASTMALTVISDISVDLLLFEVISAFATVGLSTGITDDLPAAGQVLLVVLMFTGRLGPILLASALAVRDRPLQYEYPKERPIIG